MVGLYVELQHYRVPLSNLIKEDFAKTGFRGKAQFIYLHKYIYIGFLPKCIIYLFGEYICPV